MATHHLYPTLGDLEAPFESDAQVIAAMQDPRYGTDRAYEGAVASKMEKTANAGFTTFSPAGISRETANGQ